MQNDTLVHISCPPEEDPRSRVLASAIREYMQAGPPEPQTEIGTQPDTEDTGDTGDFQTGPADTGDRDEAHPPPPQPSSTPFATHITPTLARLASQLPLHRFYRPAWQSRPLTVWERGYWLFSHTGPDPDPVIGSGAVVERRPEHATWPFISQIIQQGKAGWGVWAVRTRKRVRKPKRSPGVSSTGQIHHTQVHLQIQVYCWGEVVPYIYLLFLVGSDRRLSTSRTGRTLQWRDAADRVVVQM